ncbi:sortase A [Sediminihabitans luteus]|uniref:Sortase A n=1 Tax=Sediminihabitans luteus TaxID=1138585 RepID=A0A2M9CCP9_9CELL|nr:class E sortase [Sediminihabitans luteus]PJJ69162.1 sortase A [Sediminihabitans luteus]GII98834.1 class E sortase [Sediminihabitans luteus]
MSAPAAVRHARPVRGPGVVSHVVGGIGELLITLGLLLGLFVVWQLWWTDVQGDKFQAEVIEQLDWAPPPVVDTAPVERTDDPPVMEEPAVGDVFAQFYVPRFGADYVKPAAEGVDKATILDTIGIGHYPGTAMPGDLGNFSVAAHRTTYGKPFNKIADLQEGDPIVVRTEDTWYVYRVTEHLIVYPDQVDVIAPIPGTKAGDPVVEPTQRLLTMTSCHPMFSAAQRYIVHAEFAYWFPVSEGVPQELTEAGISPAEW